MRRRWWVTVCVYLCACSAQQVAGETSPNGGGDTRDAQVPSDEDASRTVGVAGPTHQDGHANAGEGPMSEQQGFEAARQGFRDFAAQALGRGAEALTVTPSRLEGAERQGRLGRAWAMEAYEGDARVRGWALPSGEAFSMKHELGKLLDALGVWAEPTEVKASDLAKGLVWGLRWGHRLYVNAGTGAHGPKLELDGQGRGSLVFYSAWRDPQPKGAVMAGPKEDLFKHTVTLEGRGQATHREEPWKP